MAHFILYVFHIFLSYVQAQDIDTHFPPLSCKITQVIYMQPVLLDCNGTSDSGNQWTFHDHLLYLNRFVVKKTFKERAVLYQNYSLYFKSVFLEHDGYYECTRNFTVQEKYCLQVQAFPLLTVEINGRNYTTDALVALKKKAVAYCYAVGARPPANLTWVIDNEVAPSSEVSYSTSENKKQQTYNSMAVLDIPNNKPRMNISCHASVGETHDNRNKSVITIMIKTQKYLGRNSFKIPALVIVLLVGVISLTVLLGRLMKSKNGCLKIGKKSNGGNCMKTPSPSLDRVMATTTEPTNLTSNQDIVCYASSNSLYAISSVQPSDAKKDLGKHCLDFENLSLSGYSTTIDLDYLMVPECIEDLSHEYHDCKKLRLSKGNPACHEYFKVPECTGGPYVDMTEAGSKKRIIPADYLCFVMNIKMGYTFKRWMGTVNIPNEKQKCVIISTVTDRVLDRKDFNWSEFVKRKIELPFSQRLVRTEGICIDKDHLYLLSEYLNCTTLNDCLKSSPKVPLPTKNVLTYIIHMLQGIEFLQAYGFLHPGLSAKKIILSSGEVCKLYDFCLSEDATKRVIVKKSQASCTLNDLAPEALLRHEYTSGSDVWSAAIVIWFLVSSGKQKFSLESSAFDGNESIVPQSTTWPGEYSELRNKLVFQCWTPNIASRPTVQQLRNSFEKNAIDMEALPPNERSHGVDISRTADSNYYI
ncbi:Tyrosine-protein kinase STK [Holothuria leucospilota]|uniref:Tyrosine-protein kinase STK n=1 Tax=Holothuria leucospilota TaxID=206669 RepID=A0A9Q1HLJ0_HOLLE|nr:Tyrosine-protein kinase STK [Holothuria leucospilota]